MKPIKGYIGFIEDEFGSILLVIGGKAKHFVNKEDFTEALKLLGLVDTDIKEASKL